MGEKTIIAWTDFTFNPWLGCHKISPGCKHCYAETLVRDRMGRGGFWGLGKPRSVTSSIYWRKPHSWNRQAALACHHARVFSGSLCDVFEDHETADATRPRLFELIRATPWLDWQLLTKRPERIRAHLPADWTGEGYPNVWLGTSVEDQAHAWRAEILGTIPAAVRFVSYEPALGPLDLSRPPRLFEFLDGKNVLGRLDWVICGGESGPGFRPMHLDWARSMRDQCREAGVAFFFKQSAAPRTEMGIELDGQIVREYPEPRRGEQWQRWERREVERQETTR